MSKSTHPLIGQQGCQFASHSKIKKRGIPFVFRLVLCSFALATINSRAADATFGTFVNPICEQADPWITQDHGHYLACFAEGNHAISVQISDRLTGLGVKHIVWTAPATDPASREVWAPELHRLGDRWYVYFAASDGQNKNHKAWVLQSEGNDPLGPYSLHGPLYTGDDPSMTASNCWAIDLTTMELNGRLYAIWSGWPDSHDVQYLYIAPMKDPLAMAGPRVRICADDDYLWERVDERLEGRGLNEAPEVLQHGGRTFVTYSCSGSWQPSYKLGMLELRSGGDPLDPKDWKKFPSPVFQSSAKTFGVGHNSFVKSPDGTEDWLVYHSKWNRNDGWQRTVFTQPFKWSADGLPMLGEPVAAGQVLPLPSGEKIPVVTGAQEFHFKNLQDLIGWSYFGHHQLLSLQDGWLHLGDLPANAANSFRSGEKIVLDGGDWSDFTATLQLRALQNQGEAGLLFRVQQPAVGYNAQRGYFAGYLPGQSRVVLGLTDGVNWRELASASVSGPSGSEVALSVRASGDQIQVSVQGRILLQTNDVTFPSGSFGLRVVDTHAAFSQLQIKPLADKTEVTPKTSFLQNTAYATLISDSR
ncbi:MAG TPA: glycoside hydrolase family 43 protein [Verrucomicrobiae bacterium]|nr:glycoside hydrolase family 43 protein [Verrucomicrobiae bacterium]